MLSEESVICAHPKSFRQVLNHMEYFTVNKQKLAPCHYCSQKRSLLKSQCLHPKVFVRQTTSDQKSTIYQHDITPTTIHQTNYPIIQ